MSTRFDISTFVSCIAFFFIHSLVRWFASGRSREKKQPCCSHGNVSANVQDLIPEPNPEPPSASERLDEREKCSARKNDFKFVFVTSSFALAVYFLWCQKYGHGCADHRAMSVKEAWRDSTILDKGKGYNSTSNFFSAVAGGSEPCGINGNPLKIITVDSVDTGTAKEIEGLAVLHPSMVFADSTQMQKKKVNPALVVDLQRQYQIKRLNGRIHYKSTYFGKLRVGSPSVEYELVFDTGSGHLILPSVFCKSEACKVHKRYKPSISSTARHIESDGTTVAVHDPRETLAVSFGTGEVEGIFVEDVVCIDEAFKTVPQPITSNDTSSIASGFRCTTMRILAATMMTDYPFKEFEFDGVLGLGLDALSSTPEFNFINMIVGETAPKMFGVFLGEGTAETSQLAIGGWQPDHVDGDISWSPVLQPEEGHWLIEIKSIRIDDEVLDFCEEGCKGVVDTGTALLAVPSTVFKPMFLKMKYSPTLGGLCDEYGPKVHFDVEGITLTISPEDYASPEWYTSYDAPVLESDADMASARADGFRRTDMYCKPMMMTIDMEEPLGPKLFILGDPVLRKYYTAYDAENKQVGFGLANHRRASEARLHRSPEDDTNDDDWFDGFEDDAG